MKRYTRWQLFSLLALLTLVLQGCNLFGGGNNNTGNFKTTTTGKGAQIGINNDTQAVFKGKVYFTLDHNLYMLDGTKTLHQLTRNVDVRDPVVSPDGKWIAFIVRYPNWSDLVYMPVTGGAWKVLRSGAGRYVPNPFSDVPKSTAFWYAQPAWSPDSKSLLFLSDWGKTYMNPGVDTFMLDLQVFSISLSNPGTSKPQEVAYATFGDGGLRDPQYRPGHPDQIIYTGFSYDQETRIHQRIGIYIEDPNAIVSHPYTYRPGVPGYEKDPAVELTPSINDLANMQPAFSPDGNTILYVRREDATHMSLYTMPVAEGITQNPNDPATVQKALIPYRQSSKLKMSEYISGPTWSPDGKQIIYMDYNNSTFDLWLANVVKDPKTGAYSIKDTPIQLTDAAGHLDAESRPCWSN